MNLFRPLVGGALAASTNHANYNIESPQDVQYAESQKDVVQPAGVIRLQSRHDKGYTYDGEDDGTDDGYRC